MPHGDTNAGVTRRNTSHNCHSWDDPADAARRGRTGADHGGEPRQDGVGVGHLLGGAIGVRARGERVGAPRFGPLNEVWPWAVSSLVNLGVFLAAFSLLTAARVRVRDVAIGAVFATVFWEVLQAVGEVYVRYVLGHATSVYGFFAITIGLLSWLYMGFP